MVPLGNANRNATHKAKKRLYTYIGTTYRTRVYTIYDIYYVCIYIIHTYIYYMDVAFFKSRFDIYEYTSRCTRTPTRKLERICFFKKSTNYIKGYTAQFIRILTSIDVIYEGKSTKKCK